MIRLRSLQKTGSRLSGICRPSAYASSAFSSKVEKPIESTLLTQSCFEKLYSPTIASSVSRKLNNEFKRFSSTASGEKLEKDQAIEAMQ